VDVEISPEPSDDERAAILAALSQEDVTLPITEEEHEVEP
jgi:hypothetical protein